MPNVFDPSKWYWIVAGDTSQVYSSELAAYVPVSDVTYSGWVAADNHATPIVSEQELWDYLIGRVYNSTPATAHSSSSGLKNKRLNEQLIESVYQLLFDHENRIRALESQSPLTDAAFFSYIQTLMK